ncbi:hypothetical protein FOXB_01274 [Fusarium oxysporum f. sp. conglutinans Fo5176]|uniref:Uncharacterized protein n=1 Tax=Fusarium oxysporum (strain Fo5176) TaxID=660025 RepID=F9F4E9_FUSOF|nr:hypothetical protein FOXB_01274 [Fusarium oxysporum f. sp. conglutinans Fo5176]
MDMLDPPSQLLPTSSTYNGYLSWVLEVEAQPFPTKSSTISTQRAARLSRPPRTLPASRSTPRIIRDNYAGQLINDRSEVFNGTHQQQFKAAMKSSPR